MVYVPAVAKASSEVFVVPIFPYRLHHGLARGSAVVNTSLLIPHNRPTINRLYSYQRRYGRYGRRSVLKGVASQVPANTANDGVDDFGVVHKIVLSPDSITRL